jgi:excisionase family DNA binding protein
MDESRYLTTAEVARALGVGVTTVKRWVDDGILPAHRTPGGHRKLLMADVLRLAREGKFPQGDLSLLAARSGTPDLTQLCQDLTAALLAGHGAEVRRLLRGAYYAGTAPAALADEIVAPAMARLGDDWEHGRIDVLHEHRGSMQCAAAVQELSAQLTDRPAEHRPLAVGGGPEGDPYLLATLLIELVLLDLGWDVINLGPNTPLASFTRALREFRPRLWWLSASQLVDVPAFADGYGRAFAEAEPHEVAVAIGGRALTPAIRAGLPCTTYGEGLAQLASFARALHPPPDRPPRGRPPRGRAAL